MRKTPLQALVIWPLLATPACGWIEDLKERRGDDGGQTQPRCQVPNGIPVVDQGAASRRPDPPEPTPAPGTQAATQPHAAAQGTERATVREFIRKLMDETRVVPDTAAKKGGPRGSPGSFAQLAPQQVEEFISAIIDGARMFLPKGLKDEEKWALVAAEISIESAFKPGTRGPNPGDPSKVSVSPLQITVRGNPQGPGMWEDIFVQYANLPGLTHYDGSPWDTKSTTAEQLEHSIYDGIMASLWCITEQGRRGCPDWFGGPDGPCPKTMHTAFLAWVIGGPALKSGGDLGSYDGSGGQRDAYIASIETDLKLLGFGIDLVNASF